MKIGSKTAEKIFHPKYGGNYGYFIAVFSVVCFFTSTFATLNVTAQQIRFPSSVPIPSTAPAAGGYPMLGSPQVIMPPGSNTGFSTPPTGTFASPTFDPYAPALRPSTSPAPGSSNPISRFFGWGNSSQLPQAPIIQNQVFQPSPYTTYPGQQGAIPAYPAPTYPTQPYPSGAYPSTIYPNQAPPALFPGGLGGSSPQGSAWGNSGWNTSTPQPGGFGWTPPNFGGSPGSAPVFGQNPLGSGWFSGGPTGPLWSGNSPGMVRFFQGPRFRHTWLPATQDKNSIGVNDSELSFVFALPNFLASTQPLYIIPSFATHLWDGPSNGKADLPGQAFSAFLDLGWESDPMRTFGVDLGTRLGVFSDFNAFTSDSFRVLAKALGRVRLTPNATLRLGAYWVNRNRYKLIPAGGILWTPNPDTRFDIFFPEPKLAHYLTTVGNSDVWWYLTGYYGGGTWTVERESGAHDTVDLNDVRAMLGLEFGRNDAIRQGRRIGFVEAGYSFNRELIYRRNPGDSLDDVQDSFVLRAGIGY